MKSEKHNITGYTLWKPLVIASNWVNLNTDNQENYLMIFLKEFPDLAKEFYSGNEIWIRPGFGNKYIQTIEEIISKRLKEIEKKSEWKQNLNYNQLKMLREGQRITKQLFKGIEYEINTFGIPYNQVTLDLLNFHARLVEAKGGVGLKLVPEIEK